MKSAGTQSVSDRIVNRQIQVNYSKYSEHVPEINLIPLSVSVCVCVCVGGEVSNQQANTKKI